jgi:hypothetical protein
MGMAKPSEGGRQQAAIHQHSAAASVSAACHSRMAREVASHCPDWRGVLTEFRFLKGAELCDDEADGIAQPSAVEAEPLEGEQ